MRERSTVRADSAPSGEQQDRVGTPVIDRLDLLPFDKLSWERFESIQLTVMLEVLGLREERHYGDPGQKQLGLDLIATAADGSVTALQSKNYAKKAFTAATLREAVDAFRNTRRPFTVNRFIVGVSRLVRSREVIDELVRLQSELQPRLTLELWDAHRLSQLLRPHPDIVSRYFTDETALSFCGPYAVRQPVIADTDARLFADAVTRSPEQLTGAQSLLDEADTSEVPAATIALIEAAQTKLRDAGFGAHADRHEPARAKLLVAVGRERQAARQLVDSVWAALDRGLTGNAQSVSQRLSTLEKELEDPSSIADLLKVPPAAFRLYFNPLGQLPEPSSLLVGETSDRARLLVLAGETALALDDHEWLRVAAPSFGAHTDDTSVNETHRIRLQLLVAEATEAWVPLLDSARRRLISSDLTPLIAARYARYCALHEQIDEAVTRWEEAAALASLARHWDDAGTWILSKRAYLSHWRPFDSGDLIALEIALGEQPYPAPSPVPRAAHAFESAYDDLRQENLRSAGIAAQRALRDAVALADWAGERKARNLLAAVMKASDESDRAARLLIRASATNEIEKLGETNPNRFIDVVDELEGSNHWTVGSAYRLIATQADIVPDDRVDTIAAHVLADLRAAEGGSLRDVTFYSSSRFNNALKALARLGERLSEADADEVLAFFERQPEVEPNHYRYHDEDEAVLVARIAGAHPSLAPRALAHLVPLMARAQGARKSSALSALDQYPELSRAALAAVVGEGESWAAEMLAYADPNDVTPSASAAALNRMTTPLAHSPDVHTVGTNAIGDSLLLVSQPSPERERVIEEMMRRAEDPHVSGFDKGDYLAAATNLAIELDDESKQRLFPRAVTLSTGTDLSERDMFDNQFSHPLSAVRLETTGSDIRGRATLLASLLATTETEHEEVRRIVYTLLGMGSDAFPAQALRRLGDSVKDDTAFLSGQGWAMRCLASQLWVRHGGPSHVGDRLSTDEDVRVREVFAMALAESTPKTTEAHVRSRLSQDPSYRVRRAMSRERGRPSGASPRRA